MKRSPLACAVSFVAALAMGVVCLVLLLLGLVGEPSFHCTYKPPWLYAFFPSLLLPAFAMAFASWDRSAGRVFAVISTLVFFGPLLIFPAVSPCAPDTALRYVVEKLAFIAMTALSLAASWYGMSFVLRPEQKPKTLASGVHFKVRRRILVSAFAALLVVLIVGVVVQRERVRNDAEALAGGRPYCVQIPAKDAEYKPVRQWSDLAIFALRGSGALHHAVLVIGTHQTAEVFHWSYWSQRFIAGIYGPQPIYCDPRADFLKSPGVTSVEDRTQLDFYMAGRHFSIPRAYGPVPRWAGQFGLLFNAAAPRFEPLNQTPSRTDRFKTLVEVAFQSPYGLETHLRVAGAHYIVESSADEHGLKKQIVRYARSTQPGVQYFLRSPDGRVTTLIQCSDRDDVPCGHSFEQDGWTYRFRHMPSDIADWRALQQRLTDLTRSFSKPR